MFEYPSLCAIKNPCFTCHYGKIPDDFVFHPLYASFYKSPNKNSAGACILLRRTRQIVALEGHFEPNHRAVVVRATTSLKKVQLINVYLKSGGEPHELRLTLEWTVPFLLDTEFFPIYGGDLQANPCWDTSKGGVEKNSREFFFRTPPPSRGTPRKKSWHPM